MDARTRIPIGVLPQGRLRASRPRGAGHDGGHDEERKQKYLIKERTLGQPKSRREGNERKNQHRYNNADQEERRTETSRLSSADGARNADDDGQKNKNVCNAQCDSMVAGIVRLIGPQLQDPVLPGVVSSVYPAPFF